jgi:repressor LexA
LSITAKARKLLRESQYVEESDESQAEGIPLLGRIAAGVPIEAIENTERISLSEFGNTQDTFALQVVGSSMIDDGIFDGDYVVCKRAQSAENGKIVAAIVDEENATVKRFFKEADRVRLEPSNPEFKPIYTRNCKIAGVVVGLMRKI